MRNTPNFRANRFRVRLGEIESGDSFGNNCSFLVPYGKGELAVIVSDFGGWDHVSVHVCGESRCPTWEEMCCVKELFFKDDEWAVQYHPAKANNINVHPYTLHIWRPQTAAEFESVARYWREAGAEPPLCPPAPPLPIPPPEMV
jgi:hypothetical protein